MIDFTANEDGTGGTLQVTDGTHTANINLTSDYSAGSFQATAESTNGRLVSYVLTGVTPPEQQH